MRIVLIVAALLTGAWLVTQARAAHAENELTKIAFEGQRGGDVEALLAADRLLNPDTRPDLFEGVILGRQGAIRKVTRKEPENIEAWGLLASAAKRTDPRLAAEARAAARRLAPPIR